jgi:hypothetical protein
MSRSSSSLCPVRTRRAAGVPALVGWAYVFAAVLSVTAMGREDQVGGALAALNIGLAVLIGIAALKKGFARGLPAPTFLPIHGRSATSWHSTCFGDLIPRYGGQSWRGGRRTQPSGHSTTGTASTRTWRCGCA